MARHHRARLSWRAPLAGAALLAVLAGCGAERALAPAADGGPGAEATATAPTAVAGAAGAAAGRAGNPAPGFAERGHPYFPLVPGRTSDFVVTLFERGERRMRVTVGAPEEFFGRMAYPWVYAAIPGEIPDTAFVDLRQYFSVSAEGDLLFHGAENKGFASYTDPPLRILRSDVAAGAAWSDTVTFRSFFPGGVPFVVARERYEFLQSDRATLRLPAGTIHGYRTTQVIFDGPPARDVARTSRAAAASGAAADFAAHGVSARPGDPDALKGFWFARQRGIVARDFPHGPGPGNRNIRTYALARQGWGPLPPACPCDGDGGPPDS